MSKLTVRITLYGVEVDVTGTYTPEEPMVGYYRDGSGYPGSPPDFECDKVELNGVDITALVQGMDEQKYRDIETLRKREGYEYAFHYDDVWVTISEAACEAVHGMNEEAYNQYD